MTQPPAGEGERSVCEGLGLLRRHPRQHLIVEVEVGEFGREVVEARR